MSYVDDLIRDINDLTRRIGALERIEIPPVPAIVPTFSGTPAANAIATWTASGNLAGTVSGSGMNATRNLTATSTDGPVVTILQDHASDDQSALLVAQDGQGVAMEVRSPNAKSSATVSTPLTMYSNDSAATALALLYQINGNATAGSRYTSIHSVEQGTGYRALVLNPNAEVMAVILRAFSAAGLTITDDGGNTAIFVEDGGQVGIGKASADTLLDVDGGAGTGPFLTVQGNSSSVTPGIDIKKASHATLRMNAEGFAVDVPSIYTVGAHDLGFGTNSSVALTIKNGGNIGVGTTAPQGKLHGHDGTGGFLFVSKTGIVGASQTIIPDGTGDILKYVRILGVYDNSASQVGELTTATAVSGTSDITQDGGTNTLRFSVSAGGVLTVIRQTGSATWNFTGYVVWK